MLSERVSPTFHSLLVSESNFPLDTPLGNANPKSEKRHCGQRGQVARSQSLTMGGSVDEADDEQRDALLCSRNLVCALVFSQRTISLFHSLSLLTKTRAIGRIVDKANYRERANFHSELSQRTIELAGGPTNERVPSS